MSTGSTCRENVSTRAGRIDMSFDPNRPFNDLPDLPPAAAGPGRGHRGGTDRASGFQRCSPPRSIGSRGNASDPGGRGRQGRRPLGCGAAPRRGDYPVLSGRRVSTPTRMLRPIHLDFRLEAVRDPLGGLAYRLAGVMGRVRITRRRFQMTVTERSSLSVPAA